MATRGKKATKKKARKSNATSPPKTVTPTTKKTSSRKIKVSKKSGTPTVISQPDVTFASTETRAQAIKKIKAELLKQKQALLCEAGATINNMPAAILYPDLGDQAGIEIERNFILRLRGREQKLLKKIDDALEKIENGTFGFCEVCGKEIDIRRLMARPVTTMCIECKIEQEEEERIREM